MSALTHRRPSRFGDRAGLPTDRHGGSVRSRRHVYPHEDHGLSVTWPASSRRSVPPVFGRQRVQRLTRRDRARHRPRFRLFGHAGRLAGLRGAVGVNQRQGLADRDRDVIRSPVRRLLALDDNCWRVRTVELRIRVPTGSVRHDCSPHTPRPSARALCDATTACGFRSLEARWAPTRPGQVTVLVLLGSQPRT